MDYYILFRDLDDPTPIDYVKRRWQEDLLIADRASYVWGYLRKDGVTRFCCEMEIALCGGYSQDEYAEDFRKAMHLLTKDVVEPDFRAALNCYYLEHDPDLEVEYSRSELAA